MAIATLGDLTFEGFFQPSSFSQSDSFEFSERNRIGAKPALEAAADKLTSIRLSVFFHQNTGTAPQEQVDRWMTIAKEKKPLALTLAEVYRGEFVITSLRLTTQKVADDGNLISAKLDVELLESVGLTPTPQRSRQSTLRRRQLVRLQ